MQAAAESADRNRLPAQFPSFVAIAVIVHLAVFVATKWRRMSCGCRRVTSSGLNCVLLVHLCEKETTGVNTTHI
jgi:hypothetical protein